MMPQSTDLYPPGECPPIIMAMIPTVRWVMSFDSKQANARSTENGTVTCFCKYLIYRAPVRLTTRVGFLLAL
jgi:hypothetical protein